MVEVILFAVLLALALGTSLLWGTTYERWMGLILIVASGLSPVVQVAGFMEPEVGILAIDIMVLLALLQLALTIPRFWPLGASAFHLNSVVMHFVQMNVPSIGSVVYANVSVFWSYLVVVALIFGASFECRRALQ